MCSQCSTGSLRYPGRSRRPSDPNQFTTQLPVPTVTSHRDAEGSAMKFRVERDALADAVAWTAKSLPSRPSVRRPAGDRNAGDGHADGAAAD